MLSSRGNPSPSRARRWWIAIATAALAVGGGLAYRLLPGLVGSRVERMLAAHGFPGAHVGAVRVGLDHVRLDNVTLGDGLAIGAVEIDAGASLLWRTRIHQITLRDVALSARWGTAPNAKATARTANSCRRVSGRERRFDGAGPAFEASVSSRIQKRS